jgi:hypothetical protein
MLFIRCALSIEKYGISILYYFLDLFVYTKQVITYINSCYNTRNVVSQSILVIIQGTWLASPFLHDVNVQTWIQQFECLSAYPHGASQS